MFVIRMTWHFQDGSFVKARELFPKIQPPETILLRGVRAYEAVTGTDHTLALEWEFDSLKDWEEFLPLFFADPKNADSLHQWPEPMVSTTEIWKKIE